MMGRWKRQVTVSIGAFCLVMSLFVDASTLAAQAPSDPAERLTALVIGNANYPDRPLRNPVNDARAMSVILKARGFNVTLVEDADRVKMQNAILAFGEELSAGGVGLFYYAGHGLQVRGRNYIVPTDEKIRSEASVRFEAIALDAVIEEMAQPRPNRVNIVILDACRNNPFKSRFGGTGAGLALVDAPVNFLVAYATAPGAVAVDGNSKNGLYTESLVAAMKLPNLNIEDMFKKVRAAVSTKTRHAQIPWEASSLTRDFSFKLKSTLSAPDIVVTQVTPLPPTDPRGIRSNTDNRDAELAFWDSIKSSRNAADYQAYLEAFAKGVFAPLARARIERYKGKSGSNQQPKGPRIEEIETYYTALVNSTLRKAPTAASQKVGRLRAGDRVLGTGKVEGSNWFRVLSNKGVIGFVYGGLIRKSEREIATESPLNKHLAAELKLKKERDTPPVTNVPSKQLAQPAWQITPSESQSSKLPSPADQPAETKADRRAGQDSIPQKKTSQRDKTATLRLPKVSRPALSKPNTFQDCPECPKMVSLPRGTFMMGSLSGVANERPVHRVTLRRDFAIGMNEVTLGEWKACVAAKGCKFEPNLRGGSDKIAVRNVSWIDAQQYIKWLGKVTGKPYRLPTEAEWEYASRGNTTTAYWWGNKIGSGNANCKGCGGEWNRRSPSKVRAHAPNPFGLYDMNGGVWEWVSDCWNASYVGAPHDGSSWDNKICQKHVLRGGSWRNDSSYALSSSRFFYDRDVRYLVNGFRVSLTVN